MEETIRQEIAKFLENNQCLLSYDANIPKHIQHVIEANGCPCGPRGVRLACPCPQATDELSERGYCLCRFFVTREYLQRYGEEEQMEAQRKTDAEKARQLA